jgi:hypothetical protein
MLDFESSLRHLHPFRSGRRGAAGKRSGRRRSCAIECLEERCCPSTVDIWLGGAGNYSNPANWSLGVVPNNGNLVGGQPARFTVEIANGQHNNSEVTLDINATIDNLAIDATNSLTITDNTSLTVAANTHGGSTAGTITNAGTIMLNSTGDQTSLILGGGTVTLTGGGMVTMSNNIQNHISGGSGSILSNLDNTIRGAGQIGSLSELDNGGVINANQAAGIQIQSGITVVKNTGTLEVASGGTLSLQGAVDSTGGTILASGAGSTVVLSSLTGGTLQTQNGGTIVQSGSGIFNDLTIAAGTTFTIGDGQQIYLNGTITNYGTIAVAGTVHDTDLFIGVPFTGGSVTLTGGGTLTMSNSTHNIINGVGTPNDTLTNIDNTIRGSGEISSLTPLVNQGTIDADQPHALYIHANVATTTNSGTLEATGGGTLVLAGAVNNAGATILANGANSTVILGNAGESGGTVNAGTLTTQDGGAMGPSGSATLNGVTISSGSTYTVFNGQTTYLQNAITNKGTIAVAATSNDTGLVMSGAVMLAGGGTVSLTDSTHNVIYGSNSGSLTNAANTIRGSGRVSGLGQIVNQGSILANLSNGLSVDSDIGSSGTLNPGDATVAGQITINNYTQHSSGGALNIELGGTTPGFNGFSVLNVLGNATLEPGSILNVSAVNGFVPTDNETFQFMNYGAHTGTFATINGVPGGSVTYTVNFFDTYVTLTAHVATAIPPAAATSTTTGIRGTSATLGASVNPQGSATTAYFIYGTDPTLTTGTMTASQGIGGGTTSVTVTAALSGLTPGTTYYDRVVATNAGGTTPGAIDTFSTPALPATTTVTAKDITGTTATLAGSVNPQGSATTAYFVYGTDPTLATGTTTPAPSIGSGTSPVVVTAALTGLQAGTTYYFRIVATSAAGTTPGVIASFSTPAPPPAVTVTSAQWQTASFVIGKKTKKVKAIALHFSAPIDAGAAQNLAAYTLLSGKVKKHVVTYKARAPLTLARYDVGTQAVTLFAKNAKKFTQMMQLRITAALLPDTLSRPMNKGKDTVVTINKSAFTITS